MTFLSMLPFAATIMLIGQICDIDAEQFNNKTNFTEFGLKVEML